MSVVGLGAQEQRDILQLVVAILHLGNISFVEDRSGFACVQDERCNARLKNSSLDQLELIIEISRSRLSRLPARHRPASSENKAHQPSIREQSRTPRRDTQRGAGSFDTGTPTHARSMILARCPLRTTRANS